MSDTLFLYSNARASALRYCIFGPEFEPVWFGPFPAKDRAKRDDPAKCSYLAALRAIWLASLVRRFGGPPSASFTLRLGVDAPFLLDRSHVLARNLWKKADGYDMNLQVGLSPDGMSEYAYSSKSMHEFPFMIEAFAGWLAESNQKLMTESR